MQVFHWKVDPQMEVSSTPRIRRVQFGDGYDQRAPEGLNPDLKKYNITVRLNGDEAKHLEAFLSAHGGWQAFLWSVPNEARQIRVVCHKWTSRVGLLKVTISATFEQVVR